MRISTIGFTMKQGVVNIARNKMFSFASILTMSTCIFMFGLFFTIIINFQSIVESMGDGVVITVFFDKDLEQERIDEIGDQLQAHDNVSQVEYTSPEEALEIYTEDMDGVEKELFTAGYFQGDNPLADSANYSVYMNDVELQTELVEYAESIEGVRKVNKSDVVATTLSSINRLITYASIAIISILLLIAVFLISNTVTIGVNVRKGEIAIMKYIGAKDWFVRAPFVLEGLIIGLIGAIIPLAILYFAYEPLVTYVLERFDVLEGFISFLPIQQVYATVLPAGLALGVGIGFLGSFITIRRHLRA